MIYRYNETRCSRKSSEDSDSGMTVSCKLKEKIYLYKKLIRTHETMGIWLTFWPAAWSIMLAIKHTAFPLTQLLYCLFQILIFSFTALSISAIYNDVIDKDFDKEVKRCKDRPVASGALSMREALALLIPFGIIYSTFVLQANGKSRAVILGSLVLLLIYPFAKRVTKYPALILGLTANNGILLGWIMVRDDVDWPVCLPLLSGAFFWTIVYDTIYGLQDKEDDARIGVKSMALSFGPRLRMLTATASALAAICFAATGVVAGLTWPYYVAVVVVLTHLLLQVFTVDVDDPSDCCAKYESNLTVAIILFLGIVAG